MKKNIFIVYTPYQLIAALNIVAGEKDDNLIVLVHPNLRGYMDLCKQVANTTVVLEERLIKHYGTYSNFVSHIRVLKELLTMRTKTIEISYFNRSVDVLYVPSDEVICRAAYFRLRKKNKKIKLVVYDDGLGTYSGYMFRNFSLLGRLSYGLILGHFSRNIGQVYCYRPELVENIPVCVVLNRIVCNPVIIDLFKEYCGNKAAVYKDKKLIFLDQGMGNEPTIKTCVEIIRKHFKEDEVVFKIHPRIDTDAYSGFKKSKDGLPFEILTMLFDFSKSILITHSSGSCVNPYLMFNQRPNVIMLVNVDNNNLKNRESKFFTRINKMIGEEYILMPKTVDEFEKILVRLKEKISG